MWAAGGGTRRQRRRRRAAGRERAAVRRQDGILNREYTDHDPVEVCIRTKGGRDGQTAVGRNAILDRQRRDYKSLRG